MPETRDLPDVDLHIGPLRVYIHAIFAHRLRYPDARLTFQQRPLLERAQTFEDDEPWRTGHSVSLRLPFTRWAVVVGYWDLPDPDRTESVLWDGRMVEGVTADDIADWETVGGSAVHKAGEFGEEPDDVGTVWDFDDITVVDFRDHGFVLQQEQQS